MTHRTTPASGERRAAAGLYPQYQVAAFFTYETLREGRLEGVRIADPEAGQVDDFQLLTSGRLDAYSVKWQSHPQPFTLNALISPLGKEPPLIAQLADGWKRLRARDKNRHVVVHLVTSAYPSTQGEGPLAHFLEECWTPYTKAETEGPVPEQWRPVWEKICAASGLPPVEFHAFARDCRLDFRFALPEPAEPGPLPSARDRHARIRDLDDLGGTFFRLVADSRRLVDLSRSQLIEELGWQGRLELRHSHEFPEPMIPYQQIEPTVHALERALERLPGGYLLLLGTPGSGKSTLLTQTLRYRPERVVRYYAFVPRVQNSNRGESENFLHDITLMVEDQGIRAGRSLPGFDRMLLAERLDAQLRLLHEEWEKTGRKMILLVDGLDHISREQSPTRSLLADLPSPWRVPDGVYIVLGSQTDQLPDLPYEVFDQIKESERRITMDALGREAVRRIVSKAGLDPASTTEEKDRIYQLSGGHPLALAYLFNRLRTSSTGLSQVLAATEPFPGRIDEQYRAHWRQIQPDRELVYLLALLARIRGAIELPWIEKWASPNALYRLHNEFAHYFRQEPAGRWYFFHNSFRFFLKENTERLPGVSSSEGDRSLYRRLAEAAASASAPWCWDEIFYRVKAGEGDRAQQLATLPAFREQFFAGRAWPEIRKDLDLLLPMTLPRRDVEGLARLLFIGMEIEQRAFNLNEYAECPIPELLVHLGETRAALDWDREGLQGHLEPEDSLRFAAALAKLGFEEEGRRVFDLSEPLEILGGGEVIHERQDKWDLLKVWVEVAPAFRDIPRLLEVIGQIRCEEDRYGQSSPEQATRDLQNNLRFALLQALQRLRNWFDHATVVSRWDPAQEEDWRPWFWGHITAAREAFLAGQKEVAAPFVALLLSQAAAQDLTPEEKVALAECVFRMLDQYHDARRLLEGVALPPLFELESTGLSYNEVSIRLRLHRLHAVFGDQRSLSEVVPDARNRRDQGLTLFERALVLVARLWAAAWMGRPLPSSELRLEAEKVLRLIFRRPDPDWLSWYQIAEHRGFVCRSLIGATRRNGLEGLDVLRLVFEQEWSRPEVHQVWPLDLIRQSALELADAGAPKEWAISWCESSGVQAHNEEDVPERLKHLAAQIRSWLDLDENDRARAAFKQLLHASLGVHRKDIQTNSWIAWAQRANEEDPANAPRRLQLLASALPDLDGKEVLPYAASDLLEATWCWKPQAAQLLFDWMLQQGLVGFTRGLRVLVEEGLKSGKSAARVAVLLFEEILLPLMRTAEEELGQNVATSLLKGGEGKGLAKLVDRTLVSALGSTRRSWIVAFRQSTEEVWDRITANFEDREALDRTLQPIPREEERQRSSPSAQWRSEETDLRENFQSLQDVEMYLANQSSRSYVRWENVLVDLVERLNRDDIVRLAELLREQSHSVRSLNQMARRLLSLGEPEKAWKVGELALAAAGPTGWIWRLAERVRVETFSVLREIDKKRAGELAFRMLIEDLSTEKIGFSLVGFDFHEIAPVLDDNVPFQTIWENLEPYLEALFPQHDTVEPPDFEAPGSRFSEPASVLGALVIELVDHPIADIGHGAQRIVVDLLREGEPTILAPLASALSDSDHPRQRLLVCLEAVAEENPDAIRPFLPELQSLALSSHFGERIAAYRLLDSLGVVPPPTSEFRELPSVYNLAFPKREEPYVLRQVEAHEPLPPTEDPVAISIIVRDELRAISDLTGIQSAALYNRVAQLVRDPLKPDIYEEERELRKQLTNAGLRIPFRRPRTDPVRHALFLIVAELADAGRLQPEDLASIEEFLRYADPMMLRLRPRAKPVCIPSIIPDRSDTFRATPEDWTAIVSLATSALRGTDGDTDWIILAEETCLAWLDWSHAKEKRFGILVPSPSFRPRSPGEDFLGSFCQEWPGLAWEYEHLRFGEQSLIVRRSAFRLETPARYFLAFNPSVALVLGWTFAGEDCFRWRDFEGHVMVESLWWQDGCPNLNPPETSDVGEGWLVRASPAGWQAIQARYPDLKRKLRVERTANEQQEHSVEQ